MSEEIRVVLVDDHASFRVPLAFMFGREQDMSVVAQADSLASAGEIIEDDEVAVDVAVVDLDLPDGSGAVFVSDLGHARPGAVSLVLSALSDRVRLAQAVEAGAAGVMHKSARFEEIVDAVRRLQAGKELLSQQEVIEALRLVGREREKSRQAESMLEKLTPREHEVLQALGDGLGDKEIAERFYVGVGTVRTHVTSILSKLEVHSRLQALVFAVRYGAVRIDRR